MEDKYKISLVKERNVWKLVDTEDDDRIIVYADNEETLESALHHLLLTQALNDKENV